MFYIEAYKELKCVLRTLDTLIDEHKQTLSQNEECNDEIPQGEFTSKKEAYDTKKDLENQITKYNQETDKIVNSPDLMDYIKRSVKVEAELKALKEVEILQEGK